MAENIPHEESIFLAALQKPTPEERQAYIDVACGGNSELHRRVIELLKSHDESQGPFDVPLPAAARTIDMPAESPAGEKPGTVIGPYKLLQQIGEGGMGAVYMAEQSAPVRRKVALKIIKPGMDTREVIARFEAERQALALMDHPNIARVLDGGATEAGRPYFVMELVRGVPITAYCDQNNLPVHERLELFVTVCHAVQHAHQKGIIHRDIKPSNVLVTLHDGRPIPKVIDFGVAKAIGQQLTDKTLFTQFAQMIGTPLYMSPEQAELTGLDVDTRADIYSLGVMLYELLTGTTPFESARMKKVALDEIRRMIREEDPPSPSARLSSTAGETQTAVAAHRHIDPKGLSRLVRGDLDWIVMKALEKDRNRRYETANGFAADLVRYLSDEPVEACPPSAIYRMRKFARRNRAAVLTATAILFMLVAGIAGTMFGLIHAEQRREEAEKARDGETAQRQIAETQKKKAEQAEADTLADYRASTDDAIEQLIGSKSHLGPQEKAYLERTLKRWQAFAARQGDDERSRAIRAEGHHRVALLWGKLGQREAARPEYETARRLYQELSAAFPAVPDYQYQLARTHINLGFIIVGLGQRDAARTEYETGRDLLKKLVDAFPDVSDYRQRLITAHGNLGEVLQDLGQRDAARAEFEASRELAKSLATALPDVPQHQNLLANSHNNVGGLMASLGQHDAARTEYETARDLYKTLIAANPDVPEYQQKLARTHHRLGNLLSVLGQVDAARREFETARDLFQSLAAAFPTVPDHQQALAMMHNGLGNLLPHTGDGEAARTEYETARDLQQKLAAAYPAEPGYKQALATTHNNLGSLWLELGQGDTARTEYQMARHQQEKLASAYPAVPAYQQELARTHNNLALLLTRLGQRDAARAEIETARDLYQKLAANFPTVPEYQVDLGGTCYVLGNLIRDGGQPADSLPLYDLAIRTLTSVYEKDRRAARARLFLRESYGDRAWAYDQLQKYAEAVQDWEKALELDPKYVRAYHGLGGALGEQGKFDEAIAAYQQAIQLDPKNAVTYRNLGVTLRNHEKLNEAVDAFRKSLELDPKNPVVSMCLASALVKIHDPAKLPEAMAAAGKAIELDPNYAEAHYVLGLVLADQNNLDAAAAAYRKAIDLDSKHAYAHANLGGILAQQRKLDEAITCLRTAIEINPKSIYAYGTLGIALRNQKKFDEAIAAYRKVLELDPIDEAAHNNLGNVLRDQGKLDEAITYYRKAAALDPKDVNAHTNLGDSLREMARRLANNPDPGVRDPERAVEMCQEAVKACQQAVELVPQSSGAWQSLGWAHYQAGNSTASLKALEKSCELQNGGDAGQWIVMALVQARLADEDDLTEEERTRRKAEARRWYDQSVKQINGWGPGDFTIQAIRAFRAEAAELLGVNRAIKSLEMQVAARPDAWQARVNLAQAYANEGLWEKATAEYTKAIELAPDAWEPWSARAFFHFGRQQWDSAIDDFSKSIDREPKVHANWWHRGHAYLQLAQWDKAAADFGYVIEHFPDGPEPRYLRAIALAHRNEPEKSLADLRQAMALGFRNMEQLRNDPHFAALRAREDFGALLRELEQKVKSEGK